MQIIKASFAGLPSAVRTETFTGQVWIDAVLPAADGVLVNNVFFTPGARTYWHSHERGQLLHALSGRGLICAYGESPQLLEAGDVVWTSPGEPHWHGGGLDSCLLHTAVSLGTTTWLEAVSDEEYTAAKTIIRSRT
jgi:quercetin dioxygenase-like cupin family protein